MGGVVLDWANYQSTLEPDQVLRCDPAARLVYPADFEPDQLARPGSDALPARADATVQPYTPRGRLSIFESGVAVDLRCEVKLSGRPECIAEVWLCRATDPIDGAPAKVCLKIFDQKLGPIPDEVRGGFACPNDLNKYYPIASYAYTAEAYAYDQLKGFQGTRLPYSYGFYKFKLDGDREVVGHAMEYIEADNYQLTEVMRAGDKALHKRLLSCILKQLKVFHAFDVAHCDCAERNLRLVEPANQTNGNSEFIFLDWASSRSIQREGAQAGIADRDAFDVMLADSVVGPYTEMLQWLQGGEGQALFDSLRTGPEPTGWGD